MSPLVSWFTLKYLITGASENVDRMKHLCAACICVPAAFGLIPLLPGVPHHAGDVNLGEGFCYWNLSADAVAASTMILTTSLMIVTVAINCRALCRLGKELSGSRQKRSTLIVLMLTYTVTWIA